ncbi:MAG: hypothetical protein KF870_10090 [Leadbetterella sp.]|nr:hypothetical protein [Leadbetterella sp.]
MKNTILFSLLFAAGGLMSCHRDGLLEPEVPGYFLVDRDTVKIRVAKDISGIRTQTRFIKSLVVVGDTTAVFSNTGLAALPPTFPDLRPFQRQENKNLPFQYVAYGSSLTAGFRDGGYFNDGMATSYPMLIARQMGLKDFGAPTFSSESANGVGRVVPTTFNPTGGPAPKFKMVNNNLGITGVSGKDLVLEKHKNASKISNWAVTNSERWEFLHAFENERAFSDRFGQKGWSQSYADKYNPDSRPDLITLESGYTDLIKMISGETLRGSFEAVIMGGPDVGNKESALGFGSINSKTRERNYLLCIANLPDPLDTPLFHRVTGEEVYKNMVTGRDIVFRRGTDPKDCVFLMNSALDSLLSADVHFVFKEEIIRQYSGNRMKLGGPVNLKEYYREMGGGVYDHLRRYNSSLDLYSKTYNFPVVDLHSMFKAIREGRFITDDGVLVEFRYPNGNFYSHDGFYPTAFGQAVIANEFIKVLNRHYGMKIPLIHTREYLKYGNI